MAQEETVATVRGQRVRRVDSATWAWSIEGIEFYWREAAGLNLAYRVPSGTVRPIVHSGTLNHAVLCSAAWLSGWRAREAWGRQHQREEDARGG